MDTFLLAFLLGFSLVCLAAVVLGLLGTIRRILAHIWTGRPIT
jgi:hypothetical protein